MKIRLVILMCLLTSGVYGQTGEVQEAYTYRYYATQHYHKLLLKNQPELREKWLQRERLINRERDNFQFRPFTIPIVFHVLVGPNSPSIKKADFLEQVQVLNRDFS